MHTKAHSMKWFVLLGLVLFLGMAVAPSMNADIAKTFDSEVNNNQIHNGNISREKMIEIAEAYASFEWYPTEDNIAPRTKLYTFFYLVLAKLVQHSTILFYLTAILGVKLVDTPDRDTHTDWSESVGWKADEVNIGLPYQWGGFSSIAGFNLSNPEDFYDQYTGTGSFEGKVHYAGDIFCDTQIASSRACGVDCSGFVSRCWNLSYKQSTRTLGNLNFSLPITFDDLQMGDILNRYNSHVMLFHEFIDENKTQLWVYEAGPDCKVGSWQYDIINISEDRHSVELAGKGVFKLYTYNAGNLV